MPCKADYPDADSQIAATVVAERLIIQRLDSDGRPSVRGRQLRNPKLVAAAYLLKPMFFSSSFRSKKRIWASLTGTRLTKSEGAAVTLAYGRGCQVVAH